MLTERSDHHSPGISPELYISDQGLAEDDGVGDDSREDEHDAGQDPE